MGFNVLMYVMYYSIIASLAISSFVLLYVVINLYRKNRVYEKWVVETRNAVSEVQDNVNIVDSKQLFEKDDDVGVVYEGIRDLVTDLTKKINEE